MDSSKELSKVGRVSTLHLHPQEPGAVMERVSSVEVVAGMGVQGDTRYYGRPNKTGGSSVRQVSLMEREVIGQHAQAMGLQQIAPGAVRANIETTGLDLVMLLGKQVQVGQAILLLCEARKPCAKMDAIGQGLRAHMEGNRQGVLAQVVRSGSIREGDTVLPLS